jgi:hypothetical protein
MSYFLLGYGKFMARETCHEEDIAIDDFDVIDLKDVRRIQLVVRDGY